MCSSKIYRSNVNYILFQDIYAARLEDLKKNIHPYERSYIVIDERENVQEIFTDTDIILYTKKMHKRKQISNGDL